MKKLLIISLCILLPAMSFAQPLSVRKTFHRYGKDDGVTKIVIPGIVMDFASWFVDETETAKMLRGINMIKILAVDSDEGFDGPNIGKQVLEDFRSGNFHEMLTVRDGDDNVAILVKEGKRHRKELLVIAGGKDDSAIVYLRGKISPEMLGKIGTEMNVKALKNI